MPPSVQALHRSPQAQPLKPPYRSNVERAHVPHIVSHQPTQPPASILQSRPPLQSEQKYRPSSLSLIKSSLVQNHLTFSAFLCKVSQCGGGKVRAGSRSALRILQLLSLSNFFPSLPTTHL